MKSSSDNPLADSPLNGIDLKNLPPLEELVGKNYVTMDQCAALVGKTYRTVRSWVQAGKIKGVQVGGQYRIYEDELRRFLEMGNMPNSNIDRNIEGS